MKWLDVALFKALDTNLTQAELSVMLGMAMGGRVVPKDAPCGLCGAPYVDHLVAIPLKARDPYGIHDRMCNRGGDTHMRHELINRCFWGFYKAAGKSPRMNGGPKLRKDTSKGSVGLKPADTFVPFGSAPGGEAKDYACVSQYSAATVKHPSQDEKVRMRKAKLALYQTEAIKANVAVTPLVFDTFGGYDTEVVEPEIQKLAREASILSHGMTPSSELLQQWKGILSVRLQRQLARQVIRRNVHHATADWIGLGLVSQEQEKLTGAIDPVIDWDDR